MLEVVLSSSRRVRRGPERRPQSAMRQRFMELRERGWSILAAAREVGVSRTTGNNWSRGPTGTLPAWSGRWSGAGAGAAGSASDQLKVLVGGGADRDRGSAPRGLECPADRAPAGSGTVDGLAGVCAATRPGVGVIVRSMRTVARRRVGLAIIGDGSRLTTNSERWSRSFWTSGGARSRSAVIRGRSSPPSRGCGCLTRASTRPSISRDRHCCGHRGWLRTVAPHHRSALRTGRDHRRAQQRTERRRPSFSIRCSRSTKGRSRPRTAPTGHWESQ